MKPVFGRTNADIAAEWDRAAEYRLKSLLDGADKTYFEIIVPSILDLINQILVAHAPKSCACLDVGCGVGHLAYLINKTFPNSIVDAIDISGTSVEVAKRTFTSPNVLYFWSSLEDFLAEKQYDIITANMFLMNCLDYKSALTKFNRMLKPGGSFIVTVPHPCFWPRYWNYEIADWFKYMSEIGIETNFRTSSLGEASFTTTHFHRPIESYLKAIGDAAFILYSVRELADNLPIGPDQLKLPRHLLLSGFKMKDV
ncbi:MAG TPA: class I SAM-dependent methyltransferase [Pseudolabrys sp.]|jgi:2-polyprenyl-3-methyl-5-hydroxy-6-metoxy-1,4-benzoquinol methylase